MCAANTPKCECAGDKQSIELQKEDRLSVCMAVSNYFCVQKRCAKSNFVSRLHGVRRSLGFHCVSVCSPREAGHWQYAHCHIARCWLCAPRFFFIAKQPACTQGAHRKSLLETPSSLEGEWQKPCGRRTILLPHFCNPPLPLLARSPALRELLVLNF